RARQGRAGSRTARPGRSGRGSPSLALPSCSRRRCPSRAPPSYAGSPEGVALRVIPALDLRAHRAVLARGGQRDAYAPVESVLVASCGAGDALALARAFRERLGCDECYVADLDAITGAGRQRVLVKALAGLGGRLLVDCGASAPASAAEILADGAARVGVGLETLPAFGGLEAIAAAIGPERVVLSLDRGDGALVASALHAGGLDRHDLDAVRRREPAWLGRHSSDSR